MGRAMAITFLLLLMAGAVLEAQSPPSITDDTEGWLSSPDGDTLPADTLMASTGLFAAGGAKGLIYGCTGYPKFEGSPVASVGGFGIFNVERFNANGTVGKAKGCTHGPFDECGLQSLPPYFFAPGEGLRIRTKLPLKGTFNCYIQTYNF